MKVELTLGSLRIVSEGGMVRIQCTDQWFDADQTAVLIRLLSALGGREASEGPQRASPGVSAEPAAAAIPQQPATRQAVGPVVVASGQAATRIQVGGVARQAAAVPTAAAALVATRAPADDATGEVAPPAAAAPVAPGSAGRAAGRPFAAEKPLPNAAASSQAEGTTPAEAPAAAIPAVATKPVAAAVAAPAAPAAPAAAPTSAPEQADQPGRLRRSPLEASVIAAAAPKAGAPVLPGRPAAAPAAAAASLASRPQEPSVPAAPTADHLPGRPRQTPLSAEVIAAAAARAGTVQAVRPSSRPVAATAAPLAKAAPVQGEPVPARRGPGRPRSAAKAAEAAQAAPAEAPARRGPGRPSNASRLAAAALAAAAVGVAPPAPPAAAAPPPAKAEVIAAPAAAAADSAQDTTAEAGKAKGARLVDRIDQWMRENPGPKNREQLLDVSIANGWVTGPDAGRIFAMCMNREKALFTRMPDGHTEIYLRRAELAPPTTPGRIVRRPAK